MITCIDISVDSTLLASGSLDFTVRMWSLDDNMPRLVHSEVLMLLMQLDSRQTPRSSQ